MAPAQRMALIPFVESTIWPSAFTDAFADMESPEFTD